MSVAETVLRQFGGNKFLAMTGPLPPIQTMDNGTIIHNTPLYG